MEKSLFSIISIDLRRYKCRSAFLNKSHSTNLWFLIDCMARSKGITAKAEFEFKELQSKKRIRHRKIDVLLLKFNSNIYF